jgi:hypothetical protein
MDKIFKNLKSPNVLLAVFIGVSLIVSTAVASGSLRRTSKPEVSQITPVQMQQQQAALVTENQGAPKPATKAKTTTVALPQKEEDVNIPSLGNSIHTETGAVNSLNLAPVTATTTTTHFSVSGVSGDNGNGDESRGYNGSQGDN